MRLLDNQLATCRKREALWQTLRIPLPLQVRFNNIGHACVAGLRSRCAFACPNNRTVLNLNAIVVCVDQTATDTKPDSTSAKKVRWPDTCELHEVSVTLWTK